MRLALVALSLLLFAPAASAGPMFRLEPVSGAPHFTLDIEREGVKDAAYVEPRADGMVAFTRPNGTIEYAPFSRIRRVLDPDGRDRTRDVLRGRRLGTPIPRSAKTPRGPERWKPFRLRAGPESECGSYMITDFAMMWRVADHGEASIEEQRYESIDIGYAKNIGRSQSLGLSGFFGADGARAHAGVRMQVHRWLSPKTRVELAPGVILLANEEGESRFLGPGFSGRAGASVGGWFGVTAQVFSVRREFRGARENETAWQLGLRVGNGPGIAASAAFLFAGAVSLMNTRTYAVPNAF